MFSGLPEWIRRCESLSKFSTCWLSLTTTGQSYEGGISAKPGAEAHGAYAFCALGCLSIIDSPHRIISR